MQDKLSVLKYFFKKLNPKSKKFAEYIVTRIIPLIEEVHPKMIQELEKQRAIFLENKNEDEIELFLHIYNNGSNLSFYDLNKYSDETIRRIILRSGHEILLIYWAYLKDFVTLFNLSRDYFRDKTLFHELFCKKHGKDCYGNQFDCTKYKRFKNEPNRDFCNYSDIDSLPLTMMNQFNRDIRLLNERAEYIEVKAIANNNKKHEKSNIVFTRKQILLNIEKILYHIDPAIIESDNFSNNFKPIEVQLVIFNGKILCLKVLWVDGFAELFKIHQFQEQEHSTNYTARFAEKLFTEKEFKIELNKKLSSNFDLKKYINRLGFSRILEKLFFNVIGSSKAVLITDSIDCSLLKSSDIKKLLQFIAELEYIGNENKLSKFIKSIDYLDGDF